ncbi:MAG: choice-of-anchor X domain-containing protein [Candidatus Diapherotrites archaeon]
MEKSRLWVALAILVLAALQGAFAAVSIADFNIQKDEADTNSAQVVLYISASDGNRMNFSCDNSTYYGWADYAATYSFNLNTGAGCTSGDGIKTVYLKVQDVNSNQAEANDTINLDTNGPTIGYVWHDANASDGNSMLNGSKSLIIRVSGEKDANTFASIGTISDLNLYDDGSHNDIDSNDGVYGASFSVAAFGKSASCMAYVVGKQVDKVGNISTKNSFTQLCIDLNAPTYSSENPKNYVNRRKPDINVRLLDAESGVKQGSILLWVGGAPVPDANMTKTPVSTGYLVSYTPDSNLSGTTVNVSVYFDDNAGNHSDLNWAFTIDENAPSAVSDLNVAIVAGDNDLNASWSTPSDTGGSGLSHFILYRYTQAITASNISSATTVSSGISGASRNYVDAMSTASEDITYYYAIKAVDGAGNSSAVSNSAGATVPDFNAPTDLNFYMPWYTNSGYPDINITGTDVSSARLSCNDSNYSGSFSSFPIKTFSILIGNGCTNADGNRTVYAWVFDNHDNNVKIQHSVYVDRSAPSVPSITDINHADGNNSLKWSASTDAGGGISHYKVYYGAGSGITTADAYATEYDTNFSQEVSGRSRYCYRVQAADLAGNLSDLGEEACLASDANAPAIIVSLAGYKYRGNIKYFSSGGHEIKVTGDYSLKSAYCKITYGDGNTSEFALSGPGSTLSGTILFMAIDGNAVMRVDATDSLDLNASEEISFAIDSTPPDINSLEVKQKSEAVIEITAKVSPDAERLELLNCHGGKCSPLAEFSAADLNKGTAKIDWNIAGLSLNEANIVARASDDLNNASEKSAAIMLFSAIGEKIKSIDSMQSAIDAAIAVLGDFLVEPGAGIIAKAKEAKEHLANAKNALEQGDIAAVQGEITSAARLLSEIELERPSISVKSSQVTDYAADRDSFETALSGFVSGQALGESKSLWESLAFRREIMSIEVKKGEATELQVLIVLSVKNTGSTASRQFNVVEFVPKQIGEKASLLSSNTLFEIASEDPVVSFFIAELRPGEEKTIKYKPKKAFTQEEISAIEAGAAGSFKIPVPLPSGYDTSSVSFSGTQGGIPVPLLLIIFAGLGAYLYWRLKRL